MYEALKNWSTPPEGVTQGAHQVNGGTYWDGVKRKENVEPSEVNSDNLKIDIYGPEELKPGLVSVDDSQATKPNKGFFSAKLETYGRFRDRIDRKWSLYKYRLHRVYNYGPYDPYAREIVPEKIRKKYAQYKELDPKEKRKYILTRVAGAIAITGMTYAGYKYFGSENNNPII